MTIGTASMTSFGRYSTLTCSIDIMSRYTSLRSCLRISWQATLSTWKDGSCCSCMRSIICCSTVGEVLRRKKSMLSSRIRPTVSKVEEEQSTFSLGERCSERWEGGESCIGWATSSAARKICSSRTSGCMRSLQVQLILLKRSHKQAPVKHFR